MKSLNWKEYSNGKLCKVHGMKKIPDVIYYDDRLRDEFSTAEITPKRIDDAYRYVYTGRWKQFTHFFWYRVVATPLAWLYLKLKFSHRIVNRAVLDQHRADGYFLYGNHTQAIADALIPTMIASPKDVYVIVHPNNVSMPVLGRITPSLGALPLPDTLGASRHFLARRTSGPTTQAYAPSPINPSTTLSGTISLCTASPTPTSKRSPVARCAWSLMWTARSTRTDR